MQKTIIFGNGVNSSDNVISINDFMFNRILEITNELEIKIKGFYPGNYFIELLKMFNDFLQKEKLSFDMAYIFAYEFMDWYKNDYVLENFKDEELEYILSLLNTSTFTFRLQDIVSSVSLEWLFEKSNAFSEEVINSNVAIMINSFDVRMTLNYYAPQKIENVVYLHKSILNKTDARFTNEEEIIHGDMYADEPTKQWHLFFQRLKYVHLAPLFGNSQIKNSDYIEALKNNEDFKQDMKSIMQTYEDYNELNKKMGFKTKNLREYKKDDYVSYSEKVPYSDAIVMFGINPNCDEGLILEATKKANQLICVWHTLGDKKRFKEIADLSKTKLVHSSEFMDQYKSIDWGNVNFNHTFKEKKFN